MKVLLHNHSLFNEEWAEKIHGQSLAKLNSRGGLGPEEMIGNIKRLTGREICNYDFDQAVKELLEIYEKFKEN